MLEEKEIHQTMKEFLLKEQLHALALLSPLSPVGTNIGEIRYDGDGKVKSTETSTPLKHKKKKKKQHIACSILSKEKGSS